MISRHPDLDLDPSRPRAAHALLAGLVAALFATAAAASRSTLDGSTAALAALREASTTPVAIEMEGPVPSFVRAKVAIPTSLPPDPVVQALDYLGRFRDLYRLPDPASALYLERRAGDKGEHVFFGQQVDGIPVVGAELAVHLAGGAVVATNGRWLADLTAPPPPGIAPQKALALATAYLGADRVLRTVGQPKLVIADRGLLGLPAAAQQPRLAYEVILATSGGEAIEVAWRLFVDARDGAMLWAMPASDFTPVDEDLRVSSWRGRPNDDDEVDLYDEHTPIGAPPLSPAPNPQDTSGNGFRALWALHHSYDYFHFLVPGVHRHGPDGNNGEVWVTVDVGNLGAGQAAGLYDSNADRIYLGAGSYSDTILGHEYTHALVRYAIPPFGLSGPNQTGAASESYADVFGSLIFGAFIPVPSSGAQGPTHVSQPGAADDPSPVCAPADPNFDDCGGIHAKAILLNVVAEMIADGDTVNGVTTRGIGRDKTARLYYEVLTRFLTAPASFTAVRNVTLLAADPRFSPHLTDDDRCQINNGFAAVGLGGVDSDCDGTPDATDRDDDDDGVLDILDNCPFDGPGDQTDTDGDGKGDVCDSDDDGDGIGDATDNCPLEQNPEVGTGRVECRIVMGVRSCSEVMEQPDGDRNGIGDACDDPEGDGWPDATDNCPTMSNADQADTDGDGLGDACDLDDDNDGIPDGSDACPRVSAHNPFGHLDSDGDGAGDVCDNCPLVPNPAQEDLDHDGTGDRCDADRDGDGWANERDNCPDVANSSQLDLDGNHVGLACDRDEQASISKADNEGVVHEGWSSVGDGPLRLGELEPCDARDGECPDRFDGEHFELKVGLPFAGELRLMDDRGRLLARRSVGGEHPLCAEVASNWRYVAPAGVAGGEPWLYTGPRWFLEVEATDPIETGEYPITFAQQLREPPQ